MKNIIVITDPGLDPDDVVTAWMLATLHRQGRINLMCAIANYYPALYRAQLLKGIYDSLGVNIPVGVGTDCNSHHNPNPHEFDFPLSQDVYDGASLITSALSNAADKSITLLMISGLTDIAQIIMQEPNLLSSKVKEVYIMGGGWWDGDFIIADPTASNNNFDATLDPQYVYSALPYLGIEVNILSRHAAYAASVSPIFYDRLSQSHQVGAYLHRIQSSSIRALWHKVRGNSQSERLNGVWFANRFCGLDFLAPELDDPWPYVQGFALYDPLTLAWMIHPEFFEPSCQAVNGVQCQIVGLDEETSGLWSPDGALQFISSCLV